MSLPNPSDERPSEPPQAERPSASIEEEPAPVTTARPTYEEQLAQSPYSTSREFAPPQPPAVEAPTITPPPSFSNPVPPPPPVYAAQAPPNAAPPPPVYAPSTIALAPGMEAPAAPMSYAPGSPPTAPYQPGGLTPPVYTQQPYAPYQPYMQPESASSNSIAALVCGVLAWTLCPLTALPAAVLGFAEMKKIDRGEASRAGRSMAQWGAWLGLANCILGAIGVAIYAFIIIAAISVGSATP